MTSFRRNLPDFQLANPIYVGAKIYVYVVDTNGVVTSTLAALFGSPYQNDPVTNPQTLDGDGKWERPVYTAGPVVMEVQGATVGNHRTGINPPVGMWRGTFTAGTIYTQGDIVQFGPLPFPTILMATDTYTAGLTVAGDLALGLLVTILDGAVFAGASAAFESFEDRYLGAFAANPTQDNDGGSLIVGTLYWNIGTKRFLVFTGGTSWEDPMKFTMSSLDVAGTGTYTIAAGVQGRAGYVLSGALSGNRNVVFPAALAQYIVRNETSGAFTLTVSTGAGTPIQIRPATGKVIFADGTILKEASASGGVTPLSEGGTGGTNTATALAGLGFGLTGITLAVADDAEEGKAALGIERLAFRAGMFGPTGTISGTFYTIPFNAESYDFGGRFNVSTYALTPPAVSGELWDLKAKLRGTASAAGSMTIRIFSLPSSTVSEKVVQVAAGDQCIEIADQLTMGTLSNFVIQVKTDGVITFAISTDGSQPNHFFAGHRVT